METRKRKLSSLTVILPGLNEADNLQYLYDKLKEVLGSSYWKLEILFIDDGSTDDTLRLCRELNARDPIFQYISLSRNFGHQHALTAGLDCITTETAVIMDADLQDPPEVVLEMIDLWEQGVDVAYGQRRSREGETWVKKTTAKIFYRLIRAVASMKIPEDTGDFRLMDRRVIQEVNKLRETGRFMRGLVAWVGFNQKPVFYDRKPRFRGSTKYPFLRMLKFAWNGLSSFSALPLRLATYAGVMMSSIAFALVIFVILQKIFYGHFIKGYASTMAAILFVGGCQLFFMGIIGEYLAKTFDEIKRRPLYIVRETSARLT